MRFRDVFRPKWEKEAVQIDAEIAARDREKERVAASDERYKNFEAAPPACRELYNQVEQMFREGKICYVDEMEKESRELAATLLNDTDMSNTSTFTAQCLMKDGKYAEAEMVLKRILARQATYEERKRTGIPEELRVLRSKIFKAYNAMPRSFDCFCRVDTEKAREIGEELLVAAARSENRKSGNTGAGDLSFAATDDRGQLSLAGGGELSQAPDPDNSDE